MNLCLVRHGQCGTTSIDDTLTSTGEWQAQQVGRQLAQQSITVVLSSPLLRALGTASIVAQTIGTRSIEVWPELREGLFESYQSYGREYLLQRFPLALLPSAMPAAGQRYEADTAESMFERCQHILSRLRERFGSDDAVVLITHGGLITYLLHVILQISPTALKWFEMDYGAISRVRFIPEHTQLAYPPIYPAVEVEILGINERSHLCYRQDEALNRME